MDNYFTIKLIDNMLVAIFFDTINEMPVSFSPMNHIFIKERDYFRKISFDDILLIEASGSYCNIKLNDRNILIAYNLSEIYKKLSPCVFVRVHRSFIVNINKIDSFVGNMLFIKNHSIPMSRQYKVPLLKRLNIVGNLKI